MIKTNLEITFVLPTLSYVPNGGFKVVYEYANRLFEIGHKVNLIHPNIVEYAKDLNGSKGRFSNIKFLIRKIRKKNYTGYWFPIDRNIKNFFVPTLAEKYIPKSDIIVATGWQSAKPVMSLSASKGIKFYFIQSLETWAGPEEEVIESWKYPMHKIVISKWLLDYAYSINETADYVPNGLDYSMFNMDEKPEKRNNKSILMLVSNNKVKGTEFGLKVLNEIKTICPEVELLLFGADYFEKPLPEGAKFYLNPSQKALRRLYNKSSIFLSPSLIEGFPLPPAESMMCGSALVASDIGGHKEYAVDGKNSLLFPPMDINGASQAIRRLIEDNNMRISLANQGYIDIQKYNWNDSVCKLSDIFTASFTHFCK